MDTAGSNLFSSHSKFCHGHFSAKWGGADIYIRCYPLRLPLIRGDLDIYLVFHLLSRDSYIRCWLTARRFLKALLGKQNKAWLEGTCSFCQTLYVCLSWSPSKNIISKVTGFCIIYWWLSAKTQITSSYKMKIILIIFWASMLWKNFTVKSINFLCKSQREFEKAYWRLFPAVFVGTCWLARRERVQRFWWVLKIFPHLATNQHVQRWYQHKISKHQHLLIPLTPVNQITDSK